MTDLFGQPWFGWAVGIVVGLPLALIVLTEWHTALVRAGNPLAKPVNLVRNFVLPSGALLILLTQASDFSVEATPVRVIATVFGFVVLLGLLAGINAALFTNAERDTWRQRIPSIFVDIARLFIIVAGLALLFSFVWDADVAGLFTALGVTSIVLGLALQDAVGSVISGLLLLFEQPFRLGDWLHTESGSGRVVEVNWRAVHIDTGNGIQIVPNAALATSSFTNLSRPTGAHAVSITSIFGLQDRPDQVCALLLRLAATLPQVLPDTVPTVSVDGPKTYRTSVKVASPADARAVTATMQRWAWYASRREGLHLDEADDDTPAPQFLQLAVRAAAPTLHLDADDIDPLVAEARIERFGAGEIIQFPATIPDSMRLFLSGRAHLTIALADGSPFVIGPLTPGDYIGQTALTRENVTAAVVAVDEVTMLRVPATTVDRLVHSKPGLARDLGRAIDIRRQRVADAVNELSTQGRAQAATWPLRTAVR